VIVGIGRPTQTHGSTTLDLSAWRRVCENDAIRAGAAQKAEYVSSSTYAIIKIQPVSYCKLLLEY
jgi:hypothetical protein